uniref:NAD-binding protein n=1 Tax=Halorhabdus rudnickae TaxID=1775544 RepID=UPI0010847A5C|nr:NAD-binding protein [Halorhabdus rudnickae]
MYIIIVGAGDIGTPLINIATRSGNEVVVIERNEEDKPLTPHGNVRIEPHDLLTVYSARGADPELTNVFGHYEDQTV